MFGARGCEDLGWCLQDVILHRLINASCGSLIEYCAVPYAFSIFFFRREKLYVSSPSLRKGARKGGAGLEV